MTLKVAYKFIEGLGEGWKTPQNLENDRKLMLEPQKQDNSSKFGLDLTIVVDFDAASYLLPKWLLISNMYVYKLQTFW